MATGGSLKNNRWTYPDRDSVLRGCAGALFGALPLLYTMEMWWYGRTISGGFLLLLYVPTVGVVVASAAFGAGHLMQGTDAAVTTALLGAFWAVVYLRRRSIVGPMVSHAGFNLLQLAQFIVIGR